MGPIVFLIGYESLLIPTMLQKIGFIEMWLRTRNPLYTLAPENLISAILGREEGASGNSVESCHEIICCQIRVSQNGSRELLSIFSTRLML